MRLFQPLILAALSLALAGCATVKKSPAASSPDPQARARSLESELRERDKEIERLQDELERVSRTAASVPVPQVSGKKSALVSERLNVTTESIQKALKKTGHYKGPVDGVAGAKTKDAVKAFQHAKGLKADGVVGIKTWEKLVEYL